MAAVNLPDNPSDGDTQDVGGITYTYNSSKGYWTAASSSGGGGGGASVSTSDAAPGSPSDGDLWYDTDDGGMFVYYQDTDSSQWVEVIGSQGAAGPAGPAGAAGATTAGVASVYATVDALPTSGNSQGDMAHVTANNTLYFWNGSGWYKIALINTNPSISGVASAYDLALDGTATTVTMTATDPEGLPITYSIASDTSGNIATVSQGTGASTNVFTITPSTNTAHAGSFTLTFRASDGVNLATAPATFTLQFSVQNQKYTTALITSVGANNAVNNSFDDKSTLDHTITATGDITQTTFSPYRHGGYSVKFDGSGDNLGFASLSALNVNTYMSLECWIKLDANGSYLIIGRDAGYWLMYNQTGLGGASNKFAFGTYAGGSWQAVSSTTSPDIGVWYHVVGVRENASFKIYVNGTLENTATISGSPSSGGVVGIGANTNQLGGSVNGYLADVRVIISADSSSLPYTSNFTPSTDRLTAITDTQLLACHLPYLEEGSTHNHTITPNGNVRTVPVGPHDRQEYSALSHLGSAYFDGSGDYLSVAASSDFDLGTSDFTIEAWLYFTSYTSSNNFIVGQNYFASVFQLNGSGNLQFYSSPASAYIVTGSTAVPTNQWVHVALVRNGNAWTIYLNGKSDGTATNTADAGYNSTNPLTIGYWNSTASNFVGNISDVRIVKGTAVYTADFTPPTAPLTAITNTKLLVQSTDAGIIDKSQAVQNVKLYGNTKSSTTQTKYLTSSMYFDGNGDYITLLNSTDRLGWLANLSSVGTIEAWIYPTTLRNGTNVFQNPGILTLGDTYFTLNVNSSGQLVFYWYNGSINSITSTAAISVNTWHHVAAVVTATSGSNNVTLYVDGTSVGTGTYTGTGSHTATALASSTLIGFGNSSDGASYWPGYISDLRITQGLARYTSNFTAPTAALKG